MKLNIFGKLSTGRRLQILIGLLAALLAFDAIVVWFDARQATFGTIYIATAGKIRMLSQRLAKAAQQASQGNVEAFTQLRESRDEFAAQMSLLLLRVCAAAGEWKLESECHGLILFIARTCRRGR